MINKPTSKIKAGGFTLIETLVAVLILMMAIAGPLTLASKGLQATLIAKDQVTAFYLAQDAMEYVRWIRDTNKLRASANGWMAGLDGTSNGHTNLSGAGADCTAAAGCVVDSLKDTTTAYVSPMPLNYDSANNYYTYSSGANITATIFTRTVKIVKGVAPNDCTAGHGCEASVNVTVTWSDQAGITRNAIVKEDLFDWQ